MTPRIRTLIGSPQLQPYSEGGYYREIFRSGRVVSADGNCAPGPAARILWTKC
jgi:predicted cupin superfamily sugar epimerase